MSTTEPNPQVEALLQQGIDAARAGDKATARTLLEQVVAQDQYSEKGWFWLAAVVESVEEKRVCLGNVVVINPNNQRAKRLLEQLEGTDLREQFAPGGSGVSRKTVYLAVGLGALAVIVLLVVLLGALGGGDDEQPTATDSNVAGSNETPVANQPDSTMSGETTSAPAIPTRTLPATWTPVPSLTPRAVAQATPLATPPAGLPGRIIMQSGQVGIDEVNHPIVLINPDGSNPLVLTVDSDRGHTPVLSPDGTLYAYIKFASGTGEVILQTNNFEGTQPKWSSVRWGGVPILVQQNTPNWSPDGNWIAFTAVGSESPVPDLYMVSMTGAEDSPESLVRLTKDEAAEGWPTFSPNSQMIAYTANFMKDNTSITDLRLMTIKDERVTDLTTNGAALVEGAPDWSPDGKHIVFEGKEAEASDKDIYWISTEGESPQPEKIIESDADEIQPRFSPDGRYLVFSSNRTGNWDVFIYEFATQTTYQLTMDRRTDIANDWGD
jgi:hypothetical protein